jgi:hypothetical protein
MHFKKCSRCDDHYTLTVGRLVLATRTINERRAFLIGSRMLMF